MPETPVQSTDNSGNGPRGLQRSDFALCIPIATRWSDNDMYGHVNNVSYYSFFDTAINQHLIQNGVLDPQSGDVVGMVVNSECNYLRPVSFPDALQVGIRVARLGNSSVHYQTGVFCNSETEPAALGRFVHVYVDRNTGRSVTIPEATRTLLERLQR